MDEDLFTAARRIVTYLNIDLNREGGLVSHETEIALQTLETQMRIEAQRRKANPNGENNIHKLPEL